MQIMLCAICNIASGNCSEDCKYCTQSAFVKTNIQKYRRKEIDQIVLEAKMAKKNEALGFCLVTAGLGLDDEKLEYVCEAAFAVKKAEPNLLLIACNGKASLEQLKELKKAGIFSYNHNLETSREFFPQICTTHTWESRLETNLNAKEAGLMLCCGGIYGMGESEEDRMSFRKSLKELEPFSSPINFFIANENLNLKVPKLSADEALQIIKDSKKALPNSVLMVAGGREVVLGNRQYEIFEAGAGAIVVGDYLTTRGEEPSKDILKLKEMGFSFASECH
ncbi:biotin synthase [Campylobacter helveticus]|uniref:Biotin synthase n=1 Tax=Campylobacter helveticus TaxID=28898 RepID=A0AAX2UJX3_9BACT|nr:biotin synthase [Campylobacter helveticus]ARE79762.1 biotin synthetase [Campylobacter helveticus]MCR2038622.1 biotin synthase [Campylobacter helveticus]MCR2054532.1 biotin synthase [Campylobacter helveticus]MCR2056461.1 biotin synthase [Campylobacter helveticus]MCR2059606.1 biotin synthase [Campylobacter helveticus]